MKYRLFCGLFVVAVCALSLALPGCSSKPQERPEPPPADVIVEQSISQDVQLYIRSQGETRASQFVSVPARVSGFLKEIKFKPGDVVKEGQQLFQIEPDDYIAALEALEAELKVNQAKEALARSNFERAKKLFESKTIAPEDFQTQTALLQEALGNIDRTKAAITRAKLNLSYTSIVSPVTGKTGPNPIDLGNLVGPGSSQELITVAQMDPIHVYFDIPESHFNVIQEKAQREKTDAVEASGGDFSISLIAKPDEDRGFDYHGKIQLTDNTLDLSTGTIILRGEISNPDYHIFPGQICRIRIPAEHFPDAVLVREEAINSDLNTKFLLLVDKEGVVRRRNVKIGSVFGGMRVILAGLKAGETYIYQGVQKARIDEKVNPMSEAEYAKKHNLLINGNGNGNGKHSDSPADSEAASEAALAPTEEGATSEPSSSSVDETPLDEKAAE